MLPALSLVGLLVVALSADGPEAANGAPGDCRTAGSTIDAGASARVFTRPTSEIDRIFICSFRTGRRTQIGTDDCLNSIQVDRVRFTRHLVAVDLFSCGPGGAVSTLDVRRARDGVRIRRVPAVPASPFMPGAIINATDLVLRRDGALAWIVEIRDTPSAPPRYQVRGSANGTASTLLAEGADVSPGSLAQGRSVLYWTQAGVPRSTTF